VFCCSHIKTIHTTLFSKTQNVAKPGRQLANTSNNSCFPWVENYEGLQRRAQSDTHWLTTGSRLDGGCSRNTETSSVSQQQNLSFSYVETCGMCNNPVMSSHAVILTHCALHSTSHGFADSQYILCTVLAACTY